MLLIIIYQTFLFHFYFFTFNGSLRLNCNYIFLCVIKFTMYNFASIQATSTMNKRMSYESDIMVVNSHNRLHFTVVWAAYQKDLHVINLSMCKLPDEIWLVLPLKVWINQCYWGLFITENFSFILETLMKY